MNSILLDLGYIKIYWYSVLILIAFIIGAILALKESEKWNIPREYMANYFFYLVPFVIIGARIHYVLFNFEMYTNLVDILKIWEGGLAIHGGIIAGILWTIFYTKKYKYNFFKIADIMVVSLILGQAIGRWGNFFNGEAYGPATTLQHLQNMHIPQFIIDGMYIGGKYYIPTFFYESIWCIIGFIIMLILRTNKKLLISNLTSIYLIWYGIGRLYIEGLRMDSLMIGNLKVAQIISIFMIIIGIIIFFITLKVKKYHNYYRRREHEIFY